MPTDGQTDKQTDRRTCCRTKDRAMLCVARVTRNSAIADKPARRLSRFVLQVK